MKNYDSSIFVRLNQNDIDLRTFLQKIPNLTATLPQIGCLLRRLFSFSTQKRPEDNHSIYWWWISSAFCLFMVSVCVQMVETPDALCIEDNPTRPHPHPHTCSPTGDAVWGAFIRFCIYIENGWKQIRAYIYMMMIGVCAVALLSQQFFTLATPKWKLILRGLCKMPLCHLSY